MTIHTSVSSDTTAPRRLWTQDEIDAITERRGDSVWIRNLQNGGDYDLVDAMFAYHAAHSLEDINSAYHLVVDTHGEFKPEYLTDELLNMVRTIAHDLYEALNGTTTFGIMWKPEDYRPLLSYFTANPDEWDLACTTIRMRGTGTYKELMGLLPQVKECEDTPALHSGIL